MRSRRVLGLVAAVLLVQVATVGTVRAQDAPTAPPGGASVEGPFRAIGPDGYDG